MTVCSGAGVTAVVVAFHDASAIRRFLLSVAASVFEVIVVNVEDDEAVAREVQSWGAARCVAVATNVGYAAAVNVGVANATTELVLVSNDDIDVREGSVELLVAAWEQRGGVIAPAIVDASGRRRQTVQGPVTLGSFLLETTILPAAAPQWLARTLRSRPWRVHKYRMPASIERVPGVQGSVFLCRRTLLESIPMPEHYFLYWEEREWFHRLSEVGETVWVEPAAVAVHERGDTVVRPDKQALLARNAVVCMRTVHGRPAAIVSWLAVLWWQVRLLVQDRLRRPSEPDRTALRLAGVRAALSAWTIAIASSSSSSSSSSSCSSQPPDDGPSVLVVDWLGRGGITQYALAWEHEIRETGRRSVLVSRAGREVESAPGRRLVQQPRCGGAVLWHLKVVAVATAHVVRHRPDIVVVQNDVVPAVELPLHLTVRLLRSRLVLVAHNAEPHERGSGSNLGRALMRRLPEIVTHSTHVANEFGGRSAVVLPHPLPAVEPAALPSGPPRALLFGVLERHYKGVDTFVEIARELDGWEFSLVGVGAEHFRGGPVARTVGGFLPFEELVREIERTTFVVLPYRRATQSAVVVLSQAVGRVVVATDVGGLSEQIESGVDGMLVPPGTSAREWADIIESMDDDMQQQLAGGAVDRIRAAREAFGSGVRSILFGSDSRSDVDERFDGAVRVAVHEVRTGEGP